VLLGESDFSVAILRDDSNESVKRVRVGEAFGDWTLTAVRQREVDFRRDTEDVTLPLPAPGVARAGGLPNPAGFQQLRPVVKPIVAPPATSPSQSGGRNAGPPPRSSPALNPAAASVYGAFSTEPPPGGGAPQRNVNSLKGSAGPPAGPAPFAMPTRVP
jgi:hypothetical protein